ncbi:hypothetical protein SNE35_24115 [Paucibacter sp. R3-3]|uniref:Uncharacterized protein n=1 Tax=Roseateles agri TaxID=3098619 RepID=A0ABU5DMR5_9BURK|nr:hypothetical protein [Paucibacter sp. R3-3]MDY0747610.1 hypothetical protein [Paucibacter sp. R3-3]
MQRVVDGHRGDGAVPESDGQLVEASHNVTSRIDVDLNARPEATTDKTAETDRLAPMHNIAITGALATDIESGKVHATLKNTPPMAAMPSAALI